MNRILITVAYAVVVNLTATLALACFATGYYWQGVGFLVLALWGIVL